MAPPTKTKDLRADAAPLLAKKLSEALLKERIVPRFVDSYVVEYGRYGLQVHAGLYRDLLALLQREALLAISARVLVIVTNGMAVQKGKKPIPMTRKEAAAFRQKYVAALTRQQRWDVGTALDFQSDLRMYEEILARGNTSRRTPKPFEAANHPFVDRCAFVLDSSFMEQARLAATRALRNLQDLTNTIAESVLQPASKEKSATQL